MLCVACRMMCVACRMMMCFLQDDVCCLQDDNACCLQDDVCCLQDDDVCCLQYDDVCCLQYDVCYGMMTCGWWVEERHETISSSSAFYSFGCMTGYKSEITRLLRHWQDTSDDESDHCRALDTKCLHKNMDIHPCFELWSPLITVKYG